MAVFAFFFLSFPFLGEKERRGGGGGDNRAMREGFFGEESIIHGHT